MNDYIKIPLTLSVKKGPDVFAYASVEDSIKQFIDMIIATKQGECSFNDDFGYELWSNEFEPILNIQQWQPKFMEDIKNLVEKYEHRITSVQVKEPEIRNINKKRKTDKDYRITISLDYTVKQTGERQNDVKITFEY
jgi:phage baseplate assembly protein W